MKSILAALLGTSLLLYIAAPTAVSQPSPALPVTEAMAPMVLNGYSRYPRKIGSAPVYDLDGHRVGLIQKLDADSGGKPTAMEIWLPTGRVLTVAASDISYDEQQNTVTAGLTDAQLGITLPQNAR
jgi:hypothetical protein